jgi:hypothetical protein
VPTKSVCKPETEYYLASNQLLDQNEPEWSEERRTDHYHYN